MVDTPEIWQGLRRPVMVVKHPLRGRQRLGAFALEPGRWCVMLSHYQLGCVIVTRARSVRRMPNGPAGALIPGSGLG